MRKSVFETVCKVPIQFEDTNVEVLARIVKAAARKYDCSTEIDFQNGRRRAHFIGTEACKGFIAEEVMQIFNR